MSRRIRPGWRIAGLAAIVGLLGTGMAALALADVPAGPAVRGPNPSGRPLRLARAPKAAHASAPTSQGLQLLEKAAVACQHTSYSGLQVVTWWGQHQTKTFEVEVWHQPGSTTVMQSADTPPPQLATVPQSAAADLDPDGLLWVSGPLLTLLRSNYQVVYTGHGSADHRSALVVEVRRPGGGVAARFWLDAATRLPLRRQVFGAGEHMISEDTFVSLQLGDGGLTHLPAAAASPPWAARLGQTGLTTLRDKGWPAPGQLPANLELFAATRTSGSPGQVVELTYSDGLAVVSLFVQRGELGQPMPGWHRIKLHGRTVYAVDPDEMCFAWSSGGFVYTLVADAPLATVSQVVAALPDTGGPGFWARMAHGLRRLVSWLNPLH